MDPVSLLVHHTINPLHDIKWHAMTAACTYNIFCRPGWRREEGRPSVSLTPCFPSVTVGLLCPSVRPAGPAVKLPMREKVALISKCTHTSLCVCVYGGLNTGASVWPRPDPSLPAGGYSHPYHSSFARLSPSGGCTKRGEYEWPEEIHCTASVGGGVSSVRPDINWYVRK